MPPVVVSGTQQSAGYSALAVVSIVLGSLIGIPIILFILLSIAIPVFRGQQEKSKNAEAQTAIVDALVAAKAYYTQGETFAGFSPDRLKQFERSSYPGGVVSNPTVLTPGDDAEPQRIFIGNGTNGTVPTGSIITLCSVSKGGTVYCILDDGNNTTFGSWGPADNAVGDTFSATAATAANIKEGSTTTGW
jgi:type II secretory pathway pseudopilin PulG